MRNKNVGYLIVGISIVIGIIIFIFNMGLKSIVANTCSHGPTCTMYDTISMQTWLSVAIAVLILVIGLFLIFSKEETKIITKTKRVEIEKKSKPIDYSKLDRDEKIIMRLLEEENGTIFQSNLVDKTSFSKVKVSRILDKLEGRQLIERKRRGMTNIVVLRN